MKGYMRGFGWGDVPLVESYLFWPSTGLAVCLREASRGFALLDEFFNCFEPAAGVDELDLLATSPPFMVAADMAACQRANGGRW